MIKKIIILIFINVGFSVGLKSLIIPQSALALATSNSGIGNALSADVNPASLNTIRPFFDYFSHISLNFRFSEGMFHKKRLY